MVSRVKRVRELFAGVSLRDVAVIGGVGGAVGLGAYAIYILTGQATVDTYTRQIDIINRDYIDELDQFVRLNGTGGLTQTQQDALKAKQDLLKKITDAAAAAAAQGQFPINRITDAVAILAGIAIGLKWGPNAVRGFLDAIQSRGKPSRAQGYTAFFEGAEAVGLAKSGNVPLATAFYNTTMAADSLVAVSTLQLEQAALQAEIVNLSGIALITAQIELASIAADIVLIPEIFTAVPPLI